MKECDSPFYFIWFCDELEFYSTLTLHQKINYKSNWFTDPVNGNLELMLETSNHPKL